MKSSRTWPTANTPGTLVSGRRGARGSGQRGAKPGLKSSWPVEQPPDRPQLPRWPACSRAPPQGSLRSWPAGRIDIQAGRPQVYPRTQAQVGHLQPLSPRPGLASKRSWARAPGRQQVLSEGARGLLEFGAPNDPVRRRDRHQLSGVPHRVAGAAGQSGGPSIERLEAPECAGEATGHGVEGRVDDDLDLVFPADGEMFL